MRVVFSMDAIEESLTCVCLACRQPIDVVFAIAASGACGPDNFQKMLNFVSTMAVMLNLQSSTNRMSLLTFYDSASVRFHLDQLSNITDILNAISGPYM